MAVTKLKPKQKAAKLHCTGCGVTIDAGCGCGMLYLPAGEMAAKAIKANPGKSLNVIAEETGLSRDTIQRSNKGVGRNRPTGKRIGKDGKNYPATKPKLTIVRPEPTICDTVKEVNSFHKDAMTFLTEFTDRFSVWHDTSPLINEEGKKTLMQAFYLLSDGFAKLAQKLDGR
jgi:hypothetical protein